ncbi:MAG: hypothetical protein JNM94_17475 [Phycisphaerae bacterium]|nr:hypothetical protein [Phycisphaerae bacterium]
MTATSDEPAFNDWAIRCECGYDRRRLGLEAPCPECGATPRQAPSDADIVIHGRRVIDRSAQGRMRKTVVLITIPVTFGLAGCCMSGLAGPVTTVATIILLAFASAVFLSLVAFDPTVAWVVEDDGIATYVSARREAHVPVASIARVTFCADVPAPGRLTLELETREGATWRLAIGEVADASRALTVDRLRVFLLQRGVDVRVA